MNKAIEEDWYLDGWAIVRKGQSERCIASCYEAARPDGAKLMAAAPRMAKFILEHGYTRCYDETICINCSGPFISDSNPYEFEHEPDCEWVALMKEIRALKTKSGAK